MNRRNFVVGLGTVATISGVASVTSAAFNNEVTPTTNFQIVPENAQLTVRRLQDNVDYNNLSSGNASWNSSKITDFANVTAQQGSPVVAYVNTSTNGQLGAQLAFNNSNTSSVVTYRDYEVDPGNGRYGFFEVANLGDTDENVAITLNYSSNVGTDQTLSQDQVADMFKFTDESGTVISETSSTPDGEPNASVEITSGQVETIGLKINIPNDVYNAIQEAAGGPFEETQGSIKLLDSINVGIDFFA